jgi:hypothetical protein
MVLKNKLANVSDYAKHNQPKHLKLKIYTTAPVGTLIEVHLGKSTGNAYPQGTHSQYQAFTSVSGRWEELEFTFSQIPPGSKTTENEINQITLLFNPYMSTVETYFFDELTGPGIAPGNVISSKEK